MYKGIAVNNKIVFTRSVTYDNYMAILAYWNVFFLILAQFFLLTKTKFYEKFPLWMNVMNLNVFISARKIHGPIFLYIHHVFLKSTFFGVFVFVL